MNPKGITRFFALVLMCLVGSSFGCTSSGKTAATASSVTKKQIKKEKKRELKVALEGLPETYKQFLKDVQPIIDEKTRNEFLELQRDIDRDKYIERFWKLLALAAGMERPDEFKKEYYFRLGLIYESREHLNFERPLWTRAIGTRFIIDKTRDPARIFLMNGPPQSVQQIECEDIIWPVQVWEYDYLPSIRMSKVVFVFYRANNFDYRLWLPKDPREWLFVRPTSFGQGSIAEDMMRCIEWRDLQSALNRTAAQLGGVDAEMTIQKLIEPPKIDAEGLKKIRWMSTDLEKDAPPLSNIKFFGVYFTAGVGNANKTKVEIWFTIPREELVVQELEGTRQYHIDVMFEAVDKTELEERQITQNEPWSEKNTKVIAKQLLTKRFRFDLNANDGFVTPWSIKLDEELYPGTHTFIAKFVDANDRHDEDSVPHQTRWEQKIDVQYITVRATEHTIDSTKDSTESLQTSSLREAPSVMPSESVAGEVKVQSPASSEATSPRKSFSGPAVLPLVVLPPTTNPSLGLTKFDVLIADDLRRFVDHVDFFVTTNKSFKDDEKPAAKKHSFPFSLEFDMGRIPRRHTVRAIAFDRNGGKLALHEITVNNGSHQTTVKIISPTEQRVVGAVNIQARVSVPEDRSVKYVDFYVDNDRVKRVTHEPWIATATFKAHTLAILRVVAVLDDDTIGAEDYRSVNMREGGISAEIDVDPIELYVVVKNGDKTVQDLKQSDFEIFEDGAPQRIETFEYAKNASIAVGFAVDTSGSMQESLPEVQKAAMRFVNAMLRPNDRGFTLEFNRAPNMLSPLTGDKKKLVFSLTGLRAEGSTAFYDAIVQSLYELQGIGGQRALVVLTDGDDRSSSYDFETALEYARRAGVALYMLGFRIQDSQIKAKLIEFAKVSGGRVHFVNTADELKDAFGETERDLRLQYVLTYFPRSGTKDWRKIEVRVKSKNLKVRTIPGYFP